MTVEARESVVSLGRVIGFLALAEQVPSDKEARDHIKSLTHDAASLMDHATFIGVYAPSGARGGSWRGRGSTWSPSGSTQVSGEPAHKLRLWQPPDIVRMAREWFPTLVP